MKKIVSRMLVTTFVLTAAASRANAFDECFLPPPLRQYVCKTCCDVDMEYADSIKDRLETGFENFNAGFCAWYEWCNELYDEDTHYTVYGNRLTLDQYKRIVGAIFECYEVQLGELEGNGKIIIDSVNGMPAIWYNVDFRKKGEEEWSQMMTMEFVQFRRDAEFGSKCVEGWAISSVHLDPDPAVLGAWMTEDWETLLKRAGCK